MRLLQLLRFSTLLVLLTCGLYLAGCGGSSSTPNNATTTPTISYTTTTINAVAGMPFTSAAPIITGTTPLITVSPALPSGLSINSSTGVISGTPAAAAATVAYTITASNAAGTVTFQLQIQVAPPVAPSNLVYPQTTIAATAGAAISTDTPTYTGSMSTFSVTPALPAGLVLNPSSGDISGTATPGTSSAAYTITATNASGTTSATITYIPPYFTCTIV